MSEMAKKQGSMDKIVDKISEVMTPIGAKMQSFMFVGALSETMQAILPIIVVGSFACLIAFLDIGGWQAFLAAHPAISATCMNVHSLTLSCMSLYMLLVLPYLYATRLGMKQALIMIPVSVACFLLLTPTELYKSIPSEWLGPKGLISTMVISAGVVRFTKLCIDKNFMIRMPAGVPKFVTDSFAILIPTVILVTLCAIVGQAMLNTSYGTIHNVLYTILQIPFQHVGLSLWGQTLIETSSALIMFLGIHANTIISAVEPVRLAASAENLAAWQAGLPIPNIVCGTFTNLSLLGAGGSLLSATLAVLLFAKNKQYKAVGKAALIPGIFGIGEPILFGLPIMLNPMMFIPFILTVFCNQLLVYGAIASGLVGRFTGVVVHWTVPPILNMILASSTPVRAIICQFIVLAMDLAIYYPFIKAADKVILKEEAEAEETGSAAE